MSTITPAREQGVSRPFTAARAVPRSRVASLPPVLKTNPYQRLLYGQLGSLGLEVEPRPRFKLGWLFKRRHEVGFLHFHWPEAYYRYGARRIDGLRSWPLLALFGVRLGVARALGYRVVWTIHQVYPHESANRRLERLGARMLARSSDVLIAHDEATAAFARQELGRAAAPIEIVPHGSYVGVYPDGRSREAVRAALGISPDSFTFLCFGDLRAYKDVELLFGAFAAAELPEATLVLAGGAGSETEERVVRDAAAADRRIKPLLGFVDDDRVAELFLASDAAVLPRSDGGTSGSLILALSLGAPVVAAKAPAYEELTGGEASGWLFNPHDASSLRAALEAAAADPAEARRRGLEAKRRADALDWTEIGRRTAVIFAQALEGAPA